MKKSALLALAAVALAALVWFWRSPAPGLERESSRPARLALRSGKGPPPDVSRLSLEPSPREESAASRPLPSIPLVQTPAATGAVADTVATTGAVADQPTTMPPIPREQPPTASGQAAAPRRPEVPLSGRPEWTRRLLLFGASDPDAAADWAERLPDPAERMEALQTVCFKVAEKDPAAALVMAQTRGLEEAPGVIENLVAQWASTDVNAALGWVEQRPAGDVKDALISRVALALAASAPHEASRLVEESVSPGPRQTAAAASVVHQWWLGDASAATAWVESLPPGPLQERARQELTALGKSVSR